jgi:hypothetical protein
MENQNNEKPVPALKQVDKYTVEVANSALDGIIISSVMHQNFDFHVDESTGKLIVTTKHQEVNEE